MFICISDTFNSSEDLVDTTLNSSQTESTNDKKADSSSKNITQATAVLGKKYILKGPGVSPDTLINFVILSTYLKKS